MHVCKIISKGNHQARFGAIMSSSIEKIQQLLGKTIRVEVSDGRIVQGELQCLDKDLNVVMGNGVEYYGLQSS
jgi:small nuclear ribonucleoprotein (snRNP)-like protein